MHGDHRPIDSGHTAGRPPARSRLALHVGRRSHPGSGHRRQHRHLQPDQRDAVPRTAACPIPIVSSTSIRTPSTPAAWTPTRTRPIWTWRRTPTCSPSTMAAIVPHGVNYLDEGALRPAVVEHTTAIVPVRSGTPAVARTLVHRRRGHARRRGRRRPRPPGLDEEVRRGSVASSAARSGSRACRSRSSVLARPATAARSTSALVTDFWLPISSLPAFGAPPRILERRPEEAAFLVKARLRDGVTVAQAQAAMDILGTRLAAEYPNGGSGQGHHGVRVDGRAHSPADGRACWRRSRRSCSAWSDSCWRSRAAISRRCCSCAGPPARRKCPSGWRSAPRAATRSSSARWRACCCRWPAARRLHPGLVGDSVARRARSADRRGPQPRLPRPGVRARALARHRRRIRSRAGAQGHEDRPGADAARRWRDAIVGPSLVHAQERAGRVSGGGVGRAARRHEPLPPDA